MHQLRCLLCCFLLVCVCVSADRGRGRACVHVRFATLQTHSEEDLVRVLTTEDVFTGLATPMAFGELPSSPHAQANYGLLHNAAAAGDVPEVDEWIRQHPTLPVDVPTTGSGALHYAANHGRILVVHKLLAAKANPAKRNFNNTTPIRTYVIHTFTRGWGWAVVSVVGGAGYATDRTNQRSKRQRPHDSNFVLYRLCSVAPARVHPCLLYTSPSPRDRG